VGLRRFRAQHKSRIELTYLVEHSLEEICT
jgi:hypothetical protein